jgi:hypothetical protein
MESKKKKFLKILFFLVGVLILYMLISPNYKASFKSNDFFGAYAAIILVLIFIEIQFLLRIKNEDNINNNLKISRDSTSFIRYKKEKKYVENKNYFYRDFPCNKDLFRILWIGLQYDIIKNKTNVLNALILKWCQEKRIKFITSSKYEIIPNENKFENKYEEELYNLMLDKSNNKFVNFNFHNTNSIINKISEILLKETDDLKLENKIIRVNNEDIISNNIEPEVNMVFGFKNFLLNFGNIQDKTPQEVSLWGEYLIYAELLGISSKVQKEFQKANINYSSKETDFRIGNTIFEKICRILIFFSYLIQGFAYLICFSAIFIGIIYLAWIIN